MVVSSAKIAGWELMTSRIWLLKLRNRSKILDRKHPHSYEKIWLRARLTRTSFHYLIVMIGLNQIVMWPRRTGTFRVGHHAKPCRTPSRYLAPQSELRRSYLVWYTNSVITVNTSTIDVTKKEAMLFVRKKVLRIKMLQHWLEPRMLCRKALRDEQDDNLSGQSVLQSS